MLDLCLFFTRRFVQSETNDDQFSTLFVPIQNFSLSHWASVLSWWVLLDAEHEKMSWAELTTSFGLCYNNDPMHTTSKIRRILSGCLLQNINVDFLGGCGSVQHADTHHSSQSGLMSWIWWMLPLFRVTCPSESSSNGRKLTCCLVKSWTHRGSFKNTADSLVWFGWSLPSCSYLWVQALSAASCHNSSLWGWWSWRWRTRVCLLRVSVQVKPRCSGRSTRPQRAQADPAAAAPEPLCPHLRSLSPSLRTDACSQREVSWSTRPRRTRSLRGESYILPETLNPRVWASLSVRREPGAMCLHTESGLPGAFIL